MAGYQENKGEVGEMLIYIEGFKVPRLNSLRCSLARNLTGQARLKVQSIQDAERPMGLKERFIRGAAIKKLTPRLNTCRCLLRRIQLGRPQWNPLKEGHHRWHSTGQARR